MSFYFPQANQTRGMLYQFLIILFAVTSFFIKIVLTNFEILIFKIFWEINHCLVNYKSKNMETNVRLDENIPLDLLKIVYYSLNMFISYKYFINTFLKGI